VSSDVRVPPVTVAEADKKDLVFCEAAVPRIGIVLLEYLNNPEVAEWINYSKDLKCDF
jgi:hypothetical protein